MTNLSKFKVKNSGIIIIPARKKFQKNKIQKYDEISW